MRCFKCGATVPDGNLYCDTCGARLADAASLTPAGAAASGPPQAPADPWQAMVPAAPPTFPPPLPASESYTPGTPLPGPFVSEPGWSEFGGVQAPPGLPAGSGAGYPPVPPPANAYTSPGYYSYPPGSVPSGFPPPIAPKPKRRGWLIPLVVLLVLLLVVGGVFAGIAIGRSHSGASQVAATSAASSTPDATQLYRQATGQSPSFSDSLQNAAASQWVVFQKPTYGCEIKSDGLHVHIRDADHYTYCTSGQGKFTNFAFQVDMKILAGRTGGVTFRGDTLAGNEYYLLVYPGSSYRLYIVQNHQVGAELSSGPIGGFSAGYGQTNTLTVIAQGDQIYFYANQKALAHVQDTTYTSGYVGVAAEDFNAPAEVVYTNAKIWML